mmetsp:Transcript_17901/g.30437  ORF Transcript_17901/g.30437 Transcript_17901/m.30437 type:complete len:799 (-) Transcript_17901:29-2425(-)
MPLELLGQLGLELANHSLVAHLFDLAGKADVLLVDHLHHVFGNAEGVVAILGHREHLGVLRHLVEVEVDLFEVARDLAVHVDEPVGGLPGLAVAHADLEHLLLGDLGDLDVAVLAPLLLEAVVDEAVVVAGAGVAVVDAHRVQVVLVLLEVLLPIRRLHTLLEVLQLLLHGADLVAQLHAELLEQLDCGAHLLLLLLVDLLEEGVEAVELEVLALLLPLLGDVALLGHLLGAELDPGVLQEELLHHEEHGADVALGAAEVGVLLDRVLQVADLLAHLGHVLANAPDLVLVLGEEAVGHDALVDLHLVAVLDHLGLGELEAVELQAEDARHRLQVLVLDGLHAPLHLLVLLLGLALPDLTPADLAPDVVGRGLRGQDGLNGVVLEVLDHANELLLPGVVELVEADDPDEDGGEGVDDALPHLLGAVLPIVANHLADAAAEVLGDHVVFEDLLDVKFLLRLDGQLLEGGGLLLLNLALGVMRDVDGGERVQVGLVLLTHLLVLLRLLLDLLLTRQLGVFLLQGLLHDALVQLEVVEAFLHAAEEDVVELADVLLIAQLDDAPILVGDAPEDVGGVGVLLVAQGHEPEYLFEVGDQLARLLEAVDRLLVLQVVLERLYQLQRLIVVLELEDGPHELRQIVVDLEDRVEVARVTNVLQADRGPALPLALLRVQGLVAMAGLPLFAHGGHDGLVQLRVLLGQAHGLVLPRGQAGLDGLLDLVVGPESRLGAGGWSRLGVAVLLVEVGDYLPVRSQRRVKGLGVLKVGRDAVVDVPAILDEDEDGLVPRNVDHVYDLLYLQFVV